MSADGTPTELESREITAEAIVATVQAFAVATGRFPGQIVAHPLDIWETSAIRGVALHFGMQVVADRKAPFGQVVMR